MPAVLLELETEKCDITELERIGVRVLIPKPLVAFEVHPAIGRSPDLTQLSNAELDRLYHLQAETEARKASAEALRKATEAHLARDSVIFGLPLGLPDWPGLKLVLRFPPFPAIVCNCLLGLPAGRTDILVFGLPPGLPEWPGLKLVLRFPPIPAIVSIACSDCVGNLRNPLSHR